MKILINADGVTYIDKDNYPDAVNLFAGNYVQVALGSQVGVGETAITTGTLTFEAKAPGGFGYSAIIGDDTISVATQAPIVIGSNAIGSLKCTAASVDSVGSLIELEVTAFN